MALILWIAMCIIVGLIARNTGRNFWVWFFLSIFFSPLLGGAILTIAYLAHGNKE